MSPKRSPPLLARLRAALAAAGDPRKARAVQAYLKSVEPCHGVAVPEARRIVEATCAGLAFSTQADFHAAVLAVWRGATHREERFTAITMTGLPQARPFQTPAALPLYEELISTGAWWDLVDEVAAHRLGPLLLAHHGPVAKALRRWAKGDDLWLRRAAIIAQVLAHEDVDVPLLFDCLRPSLARKEFWLRKAIGWALRHLARERPEDVKRFLSEHDAVLSGLSKREAAKGLARPRATAR